MATIAQTMNLVWRLFISLRLTFVLLGFIAVGAFVGMFFDQNLSFEEFYQNRLEGALSTKVLSFFELYDAFHSWWFSLAILLLAMNLVACSIERLPRIYFDYVRPRPYLTHRRLLGLSLKHKIEGLTEVEARDLIAKFMPIKLEKAHLDYDRDKPITYFFCDKQGLGRFGVYIVHIALLIVMFSSIYATQNGVDGHVQIEEGSKARFITRRGPGGVSYPYDLGFYIGCDDFRLRTFVDNSPMEFESDLYISLNGKDKIVPKTVRVNEPLAYAGFTFYQSSFQPVISEKIVEVEIGGSDGYSIRHRVRLNTPIHLPNGEQLSIEKIYEDFGGLGQALRVKKTNKNGDDTYFHIFRRHQKYDRLVRNDAYSIVFADIDQKYATGLSIGNVPGISIIFSGFIILLIGLYMCFFMVPIRYFARIDHHGDGYAVWIAAQGFRNPSAVKEQFMKRVEALSVFNHEESHV